MFTLEQIKEVHAKVKSGADFPQYVQELKALGLLYYNNYVNDGHTVYYGEGAHQISSKEKYAHISIANEGSKEKLKHALTIHQAGETDYFTFCRQAAEAGVDKWTVDLTTMTCTYYDKESNILIVEEISQV